MIMKKDYIAPSATIVNVNITTHLMEPSVTGTNITGDHSLEVGGTTTGADSRMDYFWDDED